MAKSKINLIGSKSMFLKFFIKIPILTIACVAVFNAVFSFVMLKLDLALELSKYFSVFTVAFSSIIISYFSAISFTNNGAVIGIISVMPLSLYSLINCAVYENNWIIFAVKLILIIVLSAVFGNYAIKKRKKIRVR